MCRGARRPDPDGELHPGPGTAAGAAGGFRHPAAPEAAGGTELRGCRGPWHDDGEHRPAQAGGHARRAARRDGPRHLRDRPGVVEQVLNTLHLAPAGTAPTAQSSPVPSQPAGTRSRAAMSSERAPQAPQRASAAAARARRHLRRTAAEPPEPTYTQLARRPRALAGPRSSSRRRRRRRLPNAPPPKPTPAGERLRHLHRAVAASDARLAQRLRRRRRLHRRGERRPARHGNLSASWVRTVAGMGWGLLPTYVGPQAPCWGGSGVLIEPGQGRGGGQGGRRGRGQRRAGRRPCRRARRSTTTWRPTTAARAARARC